jgi:dihydroneopterin aldolase
MDKIVLDGFRLPVSIGVLPRERLAPQTLILRIELYFSLECAGHSDDLADTVDYAALCERMKEVAASRHFNLLENFAETLSDMILAEFAVEEVCLLAEKPGALPEIARVGVEIRRKSRRMLSSS